MNFQAKSDGESLEIMVYDAIGPEWAGMVSAKTVTQALNENKDASNITVRINSPGGSAYDGIAIHNALKSHPAEVTTIAEGIAASAASLIFMAGNTRQMHENASLVVHRASGVAMGNTQDMAAVARDLATLDTSIAQTYATITGNDPEDVLATMTEDMLMNANDAVADGYATEIIDGNVPQVLFDKALLNHLPQDVAEQFVRRELPQTETQNMTPEEFRAENKDVVDGWLNDEHAAGYAQAKSDMDELLEACGGDKSVAFQAFSDGKSIDDVKSEHTASLAEQLEAEKAARMAAEAKAEEIQNGVDAIELDANAEIEPQPEDEKLEAVKAKASKIENEYARSAYIASLGLDPADFDFDKD